MKMKKTTFAVLTAALSFCALNQSAWAAGATVEQEGGTLTFSGVITTTACTLAVASQNQTVTLEDIPTTIFTAADQVANKSKDFNVVLENCDSQLHSNVALQFTGPGSSDAGILDNQGTAQGVAFKVTDGAGTAVPFNDTAMAPITITNGTMTLPFKADYISTAATQVPGSVTSSATFKLAYQ